MPIHYLLATGFFPPGYHLLTWEVLHRCLAYNPQRLRLLAGARCVARGLLGRFSAVCPMYIGGSFVGPKEEPSDIDVVFDCAGMDAETFPSFARDVLEHYEQWKEECGVDVYVTHPMLPHDIRDTFTKPRDDRMKPPDFRKGLAVVPPPDG